MCEKCWNWVRNNRAILLKSVVGIIGFVVLILIIGIIWNTTLFYLYLPLIIAIVSIIVFFVAANVINADTENSRIEKDFLVTPFNVGFVIAAFMLPAIIGVYQLSSLSFKPALLASIVLVLLSIVVCLWAIFSMGKLKIEDDQLIKLDGHAFIKLRVLAFLFLLIGVSTFLSAFAIMEYKKLNTKLCPNSSSIHNNGGENG